MKKTLHKWLPGREIITENRYLQFLAPWLGHPRLWHLHRRSVALGVAIGLVTGLLPGPIQILLAVIIAIPLRANVLAAAFTTFYTNPFTFIPLYLLAYQIGSWVTGSATSFQAPPGLTWSWSGIMDVVPTYLRWLASLGDTLLIGLLIQSTLFAIVGYIATLVIWRFVVTRMWRQRHSASKRRTKPS